MKEIYIVFGSIGYDHILFSCSNNKILWNKLSSYYGNKKIRLNPYTELNYIQYFDKEKNDWQVTFVHYKKIAYYECDE